MYWSKVAELSFAALFVFLEISSNCVFFASFIALFRCILFQIRYPVVIIVHFSCKTGWTGFYSLIIFVCEIRTINPFNSLMKDRKMWLMNCVKSRNLLRCEMFWTNLHIFSSLVDYSISLCHCFNVICKCAAFTGNNKDIICVQYCHRQGHIWHIYARCILVSLTGDSEFVYSFLFPR